MSAPAFDAVRTLELLPVALLVDALRLAAAEHADGRIACPVRQVVPMASPGSRLLSMTAAADDLLVHKLIAVVPANRTRGLPTIDGRLSVLDARTGRIAMTLDAASVTGRRTAALTMLGIATLAAAAPRAVLVFGTGAQASHHVDAFAALHPEAIVHVVGREPSSAARFVGEHRMSNAVALERAADAPPVDVVVTCTTSRVPVYRHALHEALATRLIVATGSFEPDAVEVEAAIVRECRVYVDDPDGAAHEAGDLIAAGIPTERIGRLVDAIGAGDVPRDRTILLKTVGCAAWDLAAARVASACL